MARATNQQSCVPNVVVHGMSVDDVLRGPLADVERNIDIVEMFTHASSVYKAGAILGFSVSAFDKFRVPAVTDVEGEASEDIVSRSGFLNAVRLIGKLRVGGLLTMAPPCSSFLQINAINCRRNAENEYLGNEQYPPVAEGNAIAKTVALLLWVANARGVAVVLENPPSSYFWKLSLIAVSVQALGMHAANTPRCAWSSEPFGQRRKKLFKFLATGSWIEKIKEKQCKCPEGKHLSLVSYAIFKGVQKFTGEKPALRQSGAYPLSLGKFIVNCWRNSRTTVSSVPSRTQSWLIPEVQSGQGVSSSPQSWLTPDVQDSVTASSVAASSSWCNPSAAS